MSGVLNVFVAQGSSGALSGSATLSDVRGGANASVAIALFAAGGIGNGGNASVTPPNWYTPPPAPTMYATLTVQVGAGTDAGSSGALAPTSGSPSWGWTQAAVGTKTASGVLRIYSDSGGSNLVATITWTVNAQRTS
jgi:hypothetical protein